MTIKDFRNALDPTERIRIFNGEDFVAEYEMEDIISSHTNFDDCEIYRIEVLPDGAIALTIYECEDGRIDKTFFFDMDYGRYKADMMVEAKDTEDAWKKFRKMVRFYDGGEDGGGGVLKSVSVTQWKEDLPCGERR